jgi:hypothetical protein
MLTGKNIVTEFDKDKLLVTILVIFMMLVTDIVKQESAFGR